jgi:hypothetical protein
MRDICIKISFSGSGGKRQDPLWELDRDSSRHQIQIEDHPRTGLLICLLGPYSGAPHATVLCLLLLISPLSLEFSFTIFTQLFLAHTLGHSFLNAEPGE